MPYRMRRSLLLQLVSVYLLFVIVVLAAGLGVNAVVEQRLSDDAYASDQALAQEIALETGLQLDDSEHSVVELGNLVQQARTPGELQTLLDTFRAARSDVDYVYWLDPLGILLASSPNSKLSLGTEFEPPGVVQQALASHSPVFEIGIAAETTLNAGVIIAYPVKDASTGSLLGIIAVNLSLLDLSEPLQNVVHAQHEQNRQLIISVLDSKGELITTPGPWRIMDTVVNDLPGADQALRGQTVSILGPGVDGQEWLFSAVPITSAGWAVVVQRPASEALAVVTQFHLWLLAVALLFALGGMLFWLLLLVRVIRPLHTLAVEHQTLPESEQAIPLHATELARRNDEVGNLARSLVRLELDGLEKLGKLETLLETSNAVVGSLDPRAVVGKIIREARRLVDVQAAAVLLPDEQGVLRVLVSDGHSERYDRALSLPPESISSSAVLALRDGRPVQKLLGASTEQKPSFSYDDGFRSVLAIPIISRHAGSVVLLVHRSEPHPFTRGEIDLLLTFANYATLAWEHAVLYERSDERLREIAQENQQLYQQASEEKQKLEAIMGSMSDGLVLTGIDGVVLYANLGASAILNVASEVLEGEPISELYAALSGMAVERVECEGLLARLETGQEAAAELAIEIRRAGQRRAIHLRLFAVNDERGQTIGRGLLLRDVTREHEIDEFKTTLLAAVGHEVRTPLAAIKGYASTLLQEDVSWSLADQRSFLQTISSESDRLAGLVSNLLDLSRQEAGLLLINRAPTNLRELAERATAQVTQPGLAIALDVPEDLPLVQIDSARVEVVLHNLLSNALVYGASEARVSAGAYPDAILISVADNGPGIAFDEIPHIFERFYRARHGRLKRSNGTGVGLAICKAFIEAHGGQIRAESDAQGTIISFSLPIVPPGAGVPEVVPVERRQI
ncbi:MAG TPA: ATP-binding protein [Ktedonobacteraceae bacterium]